MRILTLNTGSSSLKYRLSTAQRGSYIADGLVENIGSSDSKISQDTPDGRVSMPSGSEDHREAFQLMVRLLTDPEVGVITELEEIDAVGHRVVHGGDRFYESTEITPDVIKAIREFEDLAPLHNPINLLGIRIAKGLFPDVPHVAVFDTAFHQTMPREAYLYAIPLELYDRYHIRRYGFHGTSHRYVSRRAAKILGTSIRKLKMVTCHLGNGCSMAALKGGRSIDTTMGLTPLEGLVMGTRSGDLDPSVVFFLVNRRGYDIDKIERLLNKESGILGVSGLTNDVKTVLEASHKGNERAKLALDIFAYRVKKYIGAYMAALGGLDCIVFTAGIGERSADMRKMICTGLEDIGIRLDHDLNKRCFSTEMVVSSEESRVKVVVVPTDEEHVIASETYRIASKKKG